MEQIHITPFDWRGVSAYAIRGPYRATFVDRLKTIIPAKEREWSDTSKAWVISSSHAFLLNPVLRQLFYPEEFCKDCWSHKPCLSWIPVIPRTLGMIRPWQPIVKSETPPPPAPNLNKKPVLTEEKKAELLLGLTPPYSAKDIRAAWRKLAAKNHPDRGGNLDLFLQAREAAERLIGFFEEKL